MPSPNAAWRFSTRSMRHLVGVGEHLRIAVGGRERQQQPVAFLHRAALELEVLGDEARHRDRRVRRGGTPRPRCPSASGSAARRLRSSGCCARCQSDAPIADQVVSMPATISSTIVPRDVLGVQLVAVELGLEQERREVVLGLGEVLVDARLEVGVELALVDLSPCRSSADRSTSSRIMRMKRRKMSASSCGEAEHLHDHAHRDVLRVVDRGVERASCPSSASSSSLQSSRVNGSSAAIAFGANAGSNSRRAICVERRVGRDRRRDPDRRGQVVLVRAELADDDRTRREVLGVVGDRGDTVVRRPAATRRRSGRCARPGTCSRSSSQIGYGSATHCGSVWSKSVAKSLHRRVAASSHSLRDRDRELGTVGRRPCGPCLPARRAPRRRATRGAWPRSSTSNSSGAIA